MRCNYVLFGAAGFIVIIEPIKLKSMLALDPTVTLARIEQDTGVRFN